MNFWVLDLLVIITTPLSEGWGQKVCERSEHYSKKMWKYSKITYKSLKTKIYHKVRAKRAAHENKLATQQSTERDCERDLKAASRGALGSMTRFHWEFEEGEQLRAFTNGLFLLPRLGRSFARRFECRAEPSW